MYVVRLLFVRLWAAFPPVSPAPRLAARHASARSRPPPDLALAARLFSAPGPIALTRIGTSTRGWAVCDATGRGHLGSTREIAGSVGYSGRPIDMLVGVTTDARIAGAELMRHNEPVLTLGISSEDIRAMRRVRRPRPQARRVAAFGARSARRIIARATVSTGVIRDAILRTARTLALGRGLVGGDHARIDRVAFAAPAMDRSRRRGGARQRQSRCRTRACRSGRSRSRSLNRRFPRSLDRPARSAHHRPQPARSAGLHPRRRVARPRRHRALRRVRGLHSHRGTDWHRSDVFDRVELVQGAETFTLSTGDFLRIDRLAPSTRPTSRR